MSCADPESFVREGPTLTTFYFFIFFFLLYGGKKDPNTTISERLLARQRNAILMAFCWRADDGPTLNVGLVTVILRESEPVLLRNPIFL